ncbi:MAG: hypothetical protein ACK55E_10950 [Cyanobacteriota bacterium]
MQQPQPIAREQQPPVGVVVGIEAFLQTAVGRAAPALLAELAAALVELIGCDAAHDQGHAGATRCCWGTAGGVIGAVASGVFRLQERPVGDWKNSVAVLPAAAGLQIRPAEYLAQEALAAVQSGRALRRPLAQIPVFLPDLLEAHPGRVDPFPQPFPLGQAVVGLLLHRSLQAGHLLQQRPRQQAALELDRLKTDGGSGAGHGSKSGGLAGEA